MTHFRQMPRCLEIQSLALLVLWCTASLLASVAQSAAPDGQDRFFEEQVRPLLAKRCVGCHGPEKQESDVRLDSARGLQMGNGSGPLVVAGEPEHSRMLQVIRYAEDDVQMPPMGPLPAEEVAVLSEWIQRGAHWPAELVAEHTERSAVPRTSTGQFDFERATALHWAYRPIRSPQVPQLSVGAGSASPIDGFIRARLRAQGLSPSSEADRQALIRRASFDLVGLPPTFAEAQELVNDQSLDAWEKLVDRLLASPQYGQRWGRHWLDVARYADTKGYVFTENPKYPFAYTYRDYVVDALNADKPFDQFVIEQLAADQLGLASNDPSLAALGFLTVGRRFLNSEQDIIDDRIDVVTRGLMGMTVGCARCHDHKFDPIPAEDYYSLYGVFASSTEPEELPVIGETPQTDDYRAYIAERDQRQQAVDDYVAAQHAELLQEARDNCADYLLAIVKQGGKLPEGMEISYEHGEPREKLVALWGQFIAARVKAQDPIFLPWEALFALPVDEFASKSQELLEPHAEEQQGEANIHATIREHLTRAPLTSMVDVARIYGAVLSHADRKWRDVEAKVQGTPHDGLEDPLEEQLHRVLSGPQSVTDVPASQAMRLFQRDQRDKIKELERRIAEWNVESLGSPPRAMTLNDRPSPVEPVVFMRGDHNRRGPVVPRRPPQILGHLDMPAVKGSGRLELAQAIVSAENPLTARVIVNRVWMHHFGAPLVATTSDFGFRSDPPTHPELLDWLAWELIAHNWSLKWLHREIMLSETYRQSSRDDESKRHIDPENRLLWCMNRQRLEFEPMRDAMLFVADKLDLRVGGRPVDIDEAPSASRCTRSMPPSIAITSQAYCERSTIPVRMPPADSGPTPWFRNSASMP